jgi:hypothetical protein
VSGLAKLGALFLSLMGLLWTAIGLLGLVGGSLFTSLFNGTTVEGLDERQFGNIVGGVIIAVALVILVSAIVEIVVGIAAWRGSGFGRMLGVLYGLFFGITCLMASTGASSNADAARGSIFFIVLAFGYLYTAAVFIVRYRNAG